MTDGSPEPTKAVIVDIDIPFFELVAFLVKFALASIPAAIIVFILFAIGAGFIGGLAR